MSRYIDADEILYGLFQNEEEPYCRGWNDALRAAADTATAEEVKRGRWIIDREFGNDVMSAEQMVICSVCGKGIFWGKQNYCPNCGAKMDEVNKDGNEITE